VAASSGSEPEQPASAALPAPASAPDGPTGDAGFGPIVVDVGPIVVDVGPIVVDVGPIVVDVGPIVAGEARSVTGAPSPSVRMGASVRNRGSGCISLAHDHSGE